MIVKILDENNESIWEHGFTDGRRQGISNKKYSEDGTGRAIIDVLDLALLQAKHECDPADESLEFHVNSEKVFGLYSDGNVLIKADTSLKQLKKALDEAQAFVNDFLSVKPEKPNVDIRPQPEKSNLEKARLEKARKIWEFEKRIRSALREIGISLTISHHQLMWDNKLWMLNNSEALEGLEYIEKILIDAGIYEKCTCCRLSPESIKK